MITLTKAQIDALATVTGAFREDMEFKVSRPDPTCSDVDVDLGWAIAVRDAVVSIDTDGQWTTVTGEGEIVSSGGPRDLWKMIATGQV